MLARKLCMTVERLRQEITYDEFLHWKAYANRRTAAHNKAAKMKKQLIDTW